MNIDKLIRKNILALKPYSSARDEFDGDNATFLDANENPFGELNRYPDPYQKTLKEKLSKLKGVDSNQIFIGNGSDEVIDLAFRIFCNPGVDKALTFSPTYGMYDVSAGINDVELIKIPLTTDFQIDLSKTKQYLKNENLKLIFICSPNNPTGNIIEEDSIKNILQTFNGVVIVDEAYIDFSASESWIKMLTEFPNLMISQTFSKAWGLAAARVGVLYANSEIISYYNKVKPPYNVSELNQKAAVAALNNIALFEENKRIILSEKETLITSLKTLSLVKKVYPSDANFILVEVDDANLIYEELVSKKVIVRNRNQVIDNCIRISVGTPTENTLLISSLRNLFNTH